MEFKIITISNVYEGDIYNDYKKFSVIESDFYDDVISISKNGGVKFNFSRKSRWIGLSKINDYSIHNLGAMKVMIFSEKYDKDKVANLFADHYLEILETKLYRIKKSIEAFTNFKNEIGQND